MITGSYADRCKPSSGSGRSCTSALGRVSTVAETATSGSSVPRSHRLKAVLSTSTSYTAAGTMIGPGPGRRGGLRARNSHPEGGIHVIVDMNKLRGGMAVGSVGVDRLLRYQSLTPSTSTHARQDIDRGNEVRKCSWRVWRLQLCEDSSPPRFMRSALLAVTINARDLIRIR